MWALGNKHLTHKPTLCQRPLQNLIDLLRIRQKPLPRWGYCPALQKSAADFLREGALVSFGFFSEGTYSGGVNCARTCENCVMATASSTTAWDSAAEWSRDNTVRRWRRVLYIDVPVAVRALRSLALHVTSIFVWLHTAATRRRVEWKHASTADVNHTWRISKFCIRCLFRARMYCLNVSVYPSILSWHAYVIWPGAPKIGAVITIMVRKGLYEFELPFSPTTGGSKRTMNFRNVRRANC